MLFADVFQHNILFGLPTRALAEYLQEFHFSTSPIISMSDFQDIDGNGKSWKPPTYCQHIVFVSPSYYGYGHNTSLMKTTNKPMIATHGCYPYGSYTKKRNDIWDQYQLHGIVRKLLLYSSRLGAYRSPSREDSTKLALLLRTYADTLGLNFVEVGHFDEPEYKKRPSCKLLLL